MNVQLRRGVRAFESALSAQMCPVRIGVADTSAEELSSNVHGAAIGGLHFVNCFSSLPLEFQWTGSRELAMVDTYRLHIQEDGLSVYRYSQTDVRCAPGTVVLFRSGTEREGAQLSAARATHVIIPGSLLRTYINNVDEVCGRIMDANSGMTCVLKDLIRSVWEQQHSIGQVSHHYFISAVLGLLASTINEEKAPEDTSRNALDLQHMKVMRLISANFNNGDFSIRTVADILNISPRYIQAAMRNRGTSFSVELLKERLTRSRDLLSHGRMQVTQIGLDCGFQNVSHFSRSFRNHFGISPKEFQLSCRKSASADANRIRGLT